MKPSTLFSKALTAPLVPPAAAPANIASPTFWFNTSALVPEIAAFCAADDNIPVESIPLSTDVASLTTSNPGI